MLDDETELQRVDLPMPYAGDSVIGEHLAVRTLGDRREAIAVARLAPLALASFDAEASPCASRSEPPPEP